MQEASVELKNRRQTGWDNLRVERTVRKWTLPYSYISKNMAGRGWGNRVVLERRFRVEGRAFCFDCFYLRWLGVWCTFNNLKEGLERWVERKRENEDKLEGALFKAGKGLIVAHRRLIWGAAFSVILAQQTGPTWALSALGVWGCKRWRTAFEDLVFFPRVDGSFCNWEWDPPCLEADVAESLEQLLFKKSRWYLASRSANKY